MPNPQLSARWCASCSLCLWRAAEDQGVDQAQTRTRIRTRRRRRCWRRSGRRWMRLRLYPNPTAERLREKLAKLHRCHADNIIVGNGSDELLALATRAFVEPAVGQASSLSPSNKPKSQRQADACPTVQRIHGQYFTPSYSLYPVLADIHGRQECGPLKSDFSLPGVAELKRGRSGIPAALTFVTRRTRPAGADIRRSNWTRFAGRSVACGAGRSYVEFAVKRAEAGVETSACPRGADVFAKAYSLCFQRVGYFVGHRELIAALHKIRRQLQCERPRPDCRRSHAGRFAHITGRISKKSSPPANG